MPSATDDLREEGGMETEEKKKKQGTVYARANTCINSNNKL